MLNFLNTVSVFSNTGTLVTVNIEKKLHVESVGIFLVSVKTVIEHPYLCHAIVTPLWVHNVDQQNAHLLHSILTFHNIFYMYMFQTQRLIFRRTSQTSTATVYYMYIYISTWLRWSRGSVLAFSTQVRISCVIADGGTWRLKWEHLKAGESDGKLPPRTCPGCSVPEPYRSHDWALVPAKPGLQGWILMNEW